MESLNQDGHPLQGINGIPGSGIQQMSNIGGLGPRTSRVPMDRPTSQRFAAQLALVTLSSINW